MNVEFTVGEPMFAIHERHGVGTESRLLFEQGVDTSVTGVVDIGVVPTYQEFLPLGFREHRQTIQGSVRGGGNRFQNRAQVMDQPHDRGAVVAVDVVVDTQEQSAIQNRNQVEGEIN
jgi:hypothetical protein